MGDRIVFASSLLSVISEISYDCLTQKKAGGLTLPGRHFNFPTLVLTISNGVKHISPGRASESKIVKVGNK